MDTIHYQKLIISTNGIVMDQKKVDTVWNWIMEKKTVNGYPNTLCGNTPFLVFRNYF